MPWMIQKDGNQHCLYKRGSDGKPIGESLGCHATEAEAQVQMRALHAQMPEHKAVKFAEGTEDVIEGPGMPFGGPFNGRDLDQQYFSKATDFAFNWFTPGTRPLLYHHGMDEDAGVTVVGRVKAWETRPDLGVWTQAQLDKQSMYFQAIKDLVAAGKLYFSSGAMAHLVQVDQKSGEIKRWPWIELSLTPTPANLFARVDITVAEKHYKAAGLTLPDAAKAALTTEKRETLPDSDFAYIDSDGGRHLPMADASHARNALARFNQTQFESEEAKQKARRRLLARCKELGIEVSDEMMSGKAIKAASYEDIRDEIHRLVNRRIEMAGSPDDPRYCHVEGTYADHAIVTIHDAETGDRSYRVPYTLDDNGHVVSLGEAEAVEKDYVPAKAVDSLSIVDQATRLASSAVGLVQCTKDLLQRRLKEGRVLSNMNRKRIRECMDAMDGAMVALRDLYESTEPQTAKAASVRRLRAKLVAQQIEALAMN